MKKFFISLLVTLFLTPIEFSHAKETNRNVIFFNIDIPNVENIEVSGKKGNYVVSGKVHPLNEQLFYTVEDGHHEYISETKLHVNKHNTFKLNIQLKEELLPNNATLLLNIYLKKDGHIIQTYPVVLERFE